MLHVLEWVGERIWSKIVPTATDLIIIAGNSTGKDGIMGASFASNVLQEDNSNRSAVQIPDPFLEKLLIEATVEAVSIGCIKVIKDLGGGGLGMLSLRNF